MSKWHGGKGSKQRPTDKQKFDNNWDKIFAKPCPECGMKNFHKMDCSTGSRERYEQKS